MERDLEPSQMEIKGTFIYHDGPMLFWAEGSKAVYVCICTENSVESFKYLAAPVSMKTLDDLMHDRIFLRDVFTQSEPGIVFHVTTDDGITPTRSEKLSCNAIPDELLPSPRLYLNG